MRAFLGHFDELHALLNCHDVVIERSPAGMYTVYLRHQAIVSGFDPLEIAGEAWRIVCADAEVRGKSRPLLPSEQRQRDETQQAMIRHQMNMAREKLRRKLDKTRNEIGAYVRDQSLEAAKDRFMAASQRLLGAGEAPEDQS